MLVKPVSKTTHRSSHPSSAFFTKTSKMCYTFAPTPTEKLSKAMEGSRCVLQKHGLNLTNCVFTKETFLAAVPAEYQALSPVETLNSKQRILVKRWTLQNDSVSANASKLFELKEHRPTQQTLRRCNISSQFDPIGESAPIIICFSIIRQTLWRPKSNVFTKSSSTIWQKRMLL